MCTAVTLKTGDFYFGRTLDYECSYGEEAVITPRKYPFKFLNGEVCGEHYAIIGTAHIAGGYPLYYDAVNEKGLSIAALNFVGNAVYGKPKNGKVNLAQFELIPYLLGKFQSVDGAVAALKKINVTDQPFSKDMPVSELHWLIADKHKAVTLECVKDGVKIYKNNVGVLTNNPPFDLQLFNLNNYLSLSAKEPRNKSLIGGLKTYSRGMGTMGLPGDWSSQSRFVRAAFMRANSVCGKGEKESVAQFFRILGGVQQVRGCCEVREGEYEITIYTSCMNVDKGIYYYSTYENPAICGVEMHKHDLDGSKLISYKH